MRADSRAEANASGAMFPRKRTISGVVTFVPRIITLGPLRKLSMTQNNGNVPIPSSTGFRKPRFIRRLALAVVLICFSFWWFCLRAIYFAPGIRVSFSHDATPGTVAFVVHDQHDRPLVGVPVDSESFSGTAGEVLTDQGGHAAITPGESEVVAVYIDHREFHLRPGGPLGLLENLFSPICDPGLTFYVTIRK